MDGGDREGALATSYYTCAECAFRDITRRFLSCAGRLKVTPPVVSYCSFPMTMLSLEGKAMTSSHTCLISSIFFLQSHTYEPLFHHNTYVPLFHHQLSTHLIRKHCYLPDIPFIPSHELNSPRQARSTPSLQHHIFQPKSIDKKPTKMPNQTKPSSRRARALRRRSGVRFATQQVLETRGCDWLTLFMLLGGVAAMVGGAFTFGVAIDRFLDCLKGGAGCDDDSDSDDEDRGSCG